MINVGLACIEDISAIKKIADNNKQYLGFVLRPALEEACKEKRLLVLKDDTQVIGFCHYRKRKKDQVTVIYEICLAEEYRGQHLGHLLIKQLDKPIELKCPIDNPSNRFYKQNGFQLVKTIPGKKRSLNIWCLN